MNRKHVLSLETGGGGKEPIRSATSMVKISTVDGKGGGSAAHCKET